MSYEFEMGLEDLKEDLEGNDLVADEEGNLIEEPSEIDSSENSQKLDSLMALESLLAKEGTVNRAVAEHFRDILPPTTPLNSFTVEPTKVNYGIAVESVGTAVKVAALAGVALLIGGLGVVIYRIMKRRKELPKNDLAKKVTAAFASIESKLKTGLDELKASYPDLKHPQLNWSRKEAMVRVASSLSMREIDVRIMEGNYPFMDGRLLQSASDQGLRIMEFIEKEVLPKVEGLAKQGTGEDLDGLQKTIESFQLSETLPNAVAEYVKSLKVDVGDDAIGAFRETLLANVESDKIGSRVGDADPQFKEIDVKGHTALLKVKEGMTGLYTKLEKLTKDLNGKKGQVSSNYHSRLKELIGAVQVPLKSLDGVFEIRDQETAAFDRLTKIKAQTVSDGFRHLNEAYAEQAKMDKANAGKYKECVVHLKKLFSNIKEAIK